MNDSLYTVISSALSELVGVTVAADALQLVAILLTLIIMWFVVLYPVRIVIDWLFPKFFRWIHKEK